MKYLIFAIIIEVAIILGALLLTPIATVIILAIIGAITLFFILEDTIWIFAMKIRSWLYSKRLKMIIVATILSLSSYAQDFMGATEQELRNHWGLEYKYDVEITNDGYRRLLIENDVMLAAFTFDKSGYNFFTMYLTTDYKMHQMVKDVIVNKYIYDGNGQWHFYIGAMKFLAIEGYEDKVYYFKIHADL